MDIFLIPLEPVGQRFEINLAGRELILECVWNGQGGSWYMSLYDGLTKAPLLVSQPLVTGINLLAQHKYLGIEGELFIYTDGDAFAPPTADNLGTESNLYLVTA